MRAPGISHTVANSSNSIEAFARRPRPKPCGGWCSLVYAISLRSSQGCGTVRGSPAPPPAETVWWWWCTVPPPPVQQMGVLVAQKLPIRVSLPRFGGRVGLHIDLFEIP